MPSNRLKNPIPLFIILTMILFGVSHVSQNLSDSSRFPMTTETQQGPRRNDEDATSYYDEEFRFALEYPQGYILSKRPAEGKAIGSIVVYRKDKAGRIAEQSVQVTLPPLKDYGIHPGARDLQDYSVPQYFNDIYAVIIDSSEEVVINGLRALRQEYRAGELINGELRREGFGSTLDGIRYVFFDGESRYLILKGTRAGTQLLDDIAATFRFTQI